MSEDRVTILQVVDERGRAVFDEVGNWRLFQIIEDGDHEGTRGSVFDLHALTGRPLHWIYGRVVVAETGEQIKREEI